MDFLNTKQKKIVGWSISGISISILLGIVFLLGWGILSLLKELQDVLLPLGIAAICAYILHPAVVFLKKLLRVSRATAVLLLMGLTFLFLIGMGFWIGPKLYQEIVRFSSDLPQRISEWKIALDRTVGSHPELQKKLDDLQVIFQNKWPEWSQKSFSYAWEALKGVGGTAGLIVGFVFIPLYVFYFLKDQAEIEASWKNYIPLHPSPWKEELVFVIGEVNRYLIVFFRGQVLVALALGILTSIGLLCIGLPYGILLGMVTGLLSIVPYLGVTMGLISSSLIALAQPDGGWGMVAAVAAVFGCVQFLEGFFISPKIMGNRTGLHPMTVILAILIWTHLLGGIVGAILAVPLTATLRVLMFRYVWKD
ncbi:MAG: AI-2E family transporter [Verrucomicrobiota bacterium]